MFKPILTPTDLPPDGAASEGLEIDAKATVHPGNLFELAKDVAAFANAVGGTILVGVTEGPDKRLRYTPLPEPFAQKVQAAYEEAAKGRCSPQPRMAPYMAPYGTGAVVAINVWPFPGQPVGVAKDGGRTTDRVGFTFPMRVATQTAWLLPEQLPMLIDVHARSIAAVLAQVNGIFVFFPSVPSRDFGTFCASEVSVNLVSMVATFTSKPGGGAVTIVPVPLAGIKYVWQPFAGQWTVVLDGAIAHQPGAGFAFYPPGMLPRR